MKWKNQRLEAVISIFHFWKENTNEQNKIDDSTHWFQFVFLLIFVHSFSIFETWWILIIIFFFLCATQSKIYCVGMASMFCYEKKQLSWMWKENKIHYKSCLRAKKYEKRNVRNGFAWTLKLSQQSIDGVMSVCASFHTRKMNVRSRISIQFTLLCCLRLARATCGDLMNSSTRNRIELTHFKTLNCVSNEKSFLCWTHMVAILSLPLIYFNHSFLSEISLIDFGDLLLTSCWKSFVSNKNSFKCMFKRETETKKTTLEKAKSNRILINSFVCVSWSDQLI